MARKEKSIFNLLTEKPWWVSASIALVLLIPAPIAAYKAWEKKRNSQGSDLQL